MGLFIALLKLIDYLVLFTARCISYDRFYHYLSDRLTVTSWYHAKTTPATIIAVFTEG